MDLSTTWAIQFSMTWSTDRLKIMALKTGERQLFRKANRELELVSKGKYLGVMAKKKGVTAKNRVKRTQSAIQKTNLFRAAGIHESKIPPTTMLTICQNFVQPVATYTIHITPENRKLQKSWAKLEN